MTTPEVPLEPLRKVTNRRTLIVALSVASHFTGRDDLFLEYQRLLESLAVLPDEKVDALINIAKKGR